MAFDTYQAVTDKIVAMIETGAGDWRMPWHSGRDTGTPLVLPRNPVSGTRYRGMNVPLLWAASEAAGYSSHLWATYKQWQERGAQVRKGERSALIVFWKQVAAGEARGSDDSGDDDSGERRRVRFVARAYNVFAAEQVDGFTLPPAPEPSEPAGLPESERIATADAYFAAVGATVRHGGNRAFYAPSQDSIQMPEFRRFESAVAYYATLGHEHIHYTGDEKRCNREFGKRFGDNAYAFEELVAELGAAFLCAELGLSNEPRPDHAAYIDSWLRVLKSDNRAVFTAASKAQAAVDWLNEAAANAAPARLAA